MGGGVRTGLATFRPGHGTEDRTAPKPTPCRDVLVKNGTENAPFCSRVVFRAVPQGMEAARVGIRTGRVTFRPLHGMVHGTEGGFPKSTLSTHTTRATGSVRRAEILRSLSTRMMRVAWQMVPGTRLAGTKQSRLSTTHAPATTLNR